MSSIHFDDEQQQFIDATIESRLTRQRVQLSRMYEEKLSVMRAELNRAKQPKPTLGRRVLNWLDRWGT